MIALTVKMTSLESASAPESVALNVIVSAPFQSVFGIVIVATRAVISTVSDVLPVYVQIISASVLSTSLT